ncbi:hypothetical protein KSP35_08275 [Aquihabitans sp. G128]|uniref:hypothetical protein n=1 Tax=Aquihabitans sp. G128 TaxID=2849779 RepID=UPI001C238E66|nr:hypothetical protein [Aquihabitans sp. G128]QXC62767.1 hypothetical protein KSP35_08275 [Aquihabitans sp. G128]
MPNRKLIGAAAMTAALAAGGFAGAALGNPLTSGAQDGGSTTSTTAPATTGTDGAPKGGDHGPGRGFGLGGDLDVAAKALGISTDDLQAALKDGKSLADVAKAQGVDKQKVIDALVAAAEKQLDEAKAALPDRIADLVDGKVPAGGPGGFGGGHGGRGGPGGGFGRGQDLAVAAKAIGISEDDLRTALEDGKSIAEVAKAKGVSEQKVIDALVADAKAKLAEAVKSGKLTQAQADERSEDLADRTKDRVEDTHEGRPGHDGPDGAPPAAPPAEAPSTTAPGGN